MTTLVVVQARMGSRRLPGKVLADLCGTPLLRVMLERLRSAPVDRLVVATSTLSIDDDVAAVARSAGVDVVRGSEADVLARFAIVLDSFSAANVVRLTADCPLIDAQIVSAAIERHSVEGADYTSNTLVRTYPDGLDVEVVRTSALRVAINVARDSIEREHVTPFLYRHPNRWELRGFRSGFDLGDERWTVDTREDLAFVRHLVAIAGPHASWTEFLRVAGRRAEPRSGRLRLRSADERDSARLLEWRNDPDAVRFSRSRSAVTPTEHEKWMRSWLDRPATRVWVGEIEGQPIGQIRINVRDGTGLVSVGVDATHRGKKYAARMIAALVRLLRHEYQVHTLRAEIHRDNHSSTRAFSRVGFSRISDDGAFQTLVREV